MKKDYIVKTKFVFDGEFRVYAESSSQAREIVKKHCGVCLGTNIQSTDSSVLDWCFSVHPDTIIGRVNIDIRQITKQ